MKKRNLLRKGQPLQLPSIISVTGSVRYALKQALRVLVSFKVGWGGVK